MKKIAYIRRSNIKDKNEIKQLPVKKLKEEIKKLKSEGFDIINLLPKDDEQ